MYQHETQIRVSYGETDQMGYLYYGNYAQYYEVGRVELIRSLGFTYQSLEKDHGIMMPVMTLNQRFVRPGFYDELVTVRTTLRKLPDSFITFHMELFNEKGKLMNGGTAKLCFVDIASNKTIAAPSVLLDRLRPYFQD